ncbi:sensor histidine kinase [Streptomyces sp. NPDC050418]|uniref:sensor histidine kinase n=1 Tax=Streptomyces sp. NPDC050418 TaxID=3365612 RepID=UPI0037B2109E
MVTATLAAATGARDLVLGALPAAAALGVLAWVLFRPRAHRTRLARPALVCAALSLATSLGKPAPGLPTGSGWKLLEAALLLPLLAAVVRWSPPVPRWEPRAAVPLAALAVAVWPAVLIDGSFLERAGAFAFWLLPALGAVAAGAYLRRMESRRRAAVTAARRAQRLQLSRDLHDFVAHDVSGIVVQAQAARFIAATDPEQAVLALERIERAGLSALAAMDRTVEMLHGPESATAHGLPGLAQLPSLIDDFTSVGATRAELRMPPDVPDALSREAGAAAYRIVVEALTNIRRHAPGARLAQVSLTSTPTEVELRVTDDAPATRARTPRARRGGLGLPALTEHAQAVGGTLTAGPADSGGWHVTALLPRTPGAPRPTKEPQ